MTTLYVDPYVIVDVTYLVAAFRYNGTGPDDGTYGINVLLSIEGITEHLGPVYPTAAERDAALVAIGVLAQQVEAAMEAEDAEEESEL